MKKYVAGLMFSQDGTKVALIRKNKPNWQKGLLNGIGGKIEEKDFSLQYFGDKNIMTSKVAMCREFGEETGVITKPKDWNHFLTMSENNTDEQKSEFSVDFYRCFSDKVFECKTMEDEKVGIFNVHDIISPKMLIIDWIEINQENTNTIENLKWIILLALDKNPKFTQTTY